MFLFSSLSVFVWMDGEIMERITQRSLISSPSSKRQAYCVKLRYFEAQSSCCTRTHHPPLLSVVLVFNDNNQTTLNENAVIERKPHHLDFCSKQTFKPSDGFFGRRMILFGDLHYATNDWSETKCATPFRSLTSVNYASGVKKTEP